MAPSSIVVESAGSAVIQDLGRPGWTHLGIPGNGASDQHSHRCANLLVGNRESAPTVEVTGSELTFVAQSELLVAVTGAADHVLVDGARQPAWEPILVFPGSRVRLAIGAAGLRTYLAVNGRIEADTVFGSVAPDHLLGVGRRLAAGDRVLVDTTYTGHPRGTHYALFRLGVTPPLESALVEIAATPGPELSRMAKGEQCLGSTYIVSEQSDHIGLRMLGPDIKQTSTTEILSRGVPVGAIQVPPAGGVIVLLRGRLVTAGYPIIGVATTTSIDRLGQARPGDTVRFSFTDVATARTQVQVRARQRDEITGRVNRAFCSAGLGHILSPPQLLGCP